MKKFLKIPTTGVRGTYYLNVLNVMYCKPTSATTTALVTNAINIDEQVACVITITHAAETDNAMTRWWYDNLKRIVNAPYNEAIFDSTPPPFEISNISGFSS